MSSARATPALVLALTILGARALTGAPPDPATFSIAAADPASGEVGVAVASRFFAVGTVVPFARAGAGAVATQASANTSFGPNGLDLMARGATAEETLKVLLRGDDGRDRRQVGLVTASGDSATYTGPGCNSWAGGRRGPNYAVQGNILTGEAVVAAMEKSFLGSEGKTSRRAAPRGPRRGRRRRRGQPRTAVGRAPRLPREGGLQRLHRPGGRRPRGRPRRPVPRAVAPRGDGRRQRPLEPWLDSVHGEAVRRGAEVAGAGDRPRRGAAGDASRGRLRPRRHPARRRATAPAPSPRLDAR